MKFKPKTQIRMGVALSFFFVWIAFDPDENLIGTAATETATRTTGLTHGLMEVCRIGSIAVNLGAIGFGVFFAVQGIKRLRAEKQDLST